jgi:hypothetical protein
VHIGIEEVGEGGQIGRFKCHPDLLGNAFRGV